MEKVKEVKTYQVRLFCDNCPDVEMSAVIEAVVLPASSWRYQCPQCQTIVKKNRCYPYVKYKTVEA